MKEIVPILLIKFVHKPLVSADVSDSQRRSENESVQKHARKNSPRTDGLLFFNGYRRFPLAGLFAFCLMCLTSDFMLNSCCSPDSNSLSSQTSGRQKFHIKSSCGNIQRVSQRGGTDRFDQTRHTVLFESLPDKALYVRPCHFAKQGGRHG